MTRGFKSINIPCSHSKRILGHKTACVVVIHDVEKGLRQFPIDIAVTD